MYIRLSLHPQIPDNMPARGFRFHATPPKYEGSTGIQVRAFAMTGHQEDFDTRDQDVSSSQTSIIVLIVCGLVFAVWKNMF